MVENGFVFGRSDDIATSTSVIRGIFYSADYCIRGTRTSCASNLKDMVVARAQ